MELVVGDMTVDEGGDSLTKDGVARDMPKIPHISQGCVT